jgi:hypothetical protein
VSLGDTGEIRSDPRQPGERVVVRRVVRRWCRVCGGLMSGAGWDHMDCHREAQPGDPGYRPDEAEL